MLKKEQLLKILKKYGFYSLNRAPYLYQNKEQSGIYFVWPNKHYGNLERVLYFNELEEAEEEVFKYWWFLNHKDTMLIEVELEDYEKLNPHVHYLYKNTILTANMMKSLEQDDTAIISHKESIKKKQLFRTASIIISILKEKFKLQNETYFKVLEMQENLKQLNNEYNKLLTKYKKAQEEVPESYELLHDEQDDSEELVRVLYSDLEQLSSVEEIREFISNLFGYLINLDTSEVHLQNIYLLNRYPYEIALMEQKNTILKDALKEKKKLFKSKTDAMQLIKEAEDKSECTHMINVNVYIEKEKKESKKNICFRMKLMRLF